MPLPLLLAAAASLPLLAGSTHPMRPLPIRTIPTQQVLYASLEELLPPPAVPRRHEFVSAAEAGFRFSTLVQAEASIHTELRNGAFPGAAFAVGRRGQIVLEQGFGRTRWDAAAPVVDADETVYDLASLTKVLATTTAVMLLFEEGRIDLDARVSRYLPEFGGGPKDRVTVRHLLTHTSGLPAGAALWGTPDEAAYRALGIALTRPAGERVEYSDIGFIVLWQLAQRIVGAEPLPQLLERRVFGPLQMTSTRFDPGEGCARCAPTARRRDGTDVQGRVHDPLAQRLGGVAGHAGLFSTAHDVARFAAMLANAGELEGVRIFEPGTVRLFTQRQPGAASRALGWDTPASTAGGAAGQHISRRAYGHTGFTGTSLWVDPERGTWVVLLANRTFEPLGPNRMQAIRRTVHDFVALASDRMMLAEEE